MENYIINETKATPYVNLNINTGVLNIKGRSIPENSVAFYDPIHNALKEYLKKPQSKTTVNIQLDYLNSSSTASILNILREFENTDKNNSIEINWMYEVEDEDILTVGQNFEGLINLKFNMIPVKEEDNS